MPLRLGPFLLMAFSLSAQQPPVGQSLNFYSREKEAGLGAHLAAQVELTTTAMESAAVREYVERVGRQLSLQLPNALFPYKFTVVAEDMGSLREPLALPGGYIFIPANLIVAARDRTGFATMMAHAMAHVAERQSTRLGTRGELSNASGAPLIFMGVMSGDAAVPLGYRKFMEKFETDATALTDKMMSGAAFDSSADEFTQIQEELRRLTAVPRPSPPSLLR